MASSKRLTFFADWAVSPPGPRDFVFAVGILLLVATFSWNGIRNKSTTVDEVAHIVAGHAYWTLDDYRLIPESGNLPNRIAALPLQLGNRQNPINTESPSWLKSDQWGLVREWWYESGTDPARVLFRCRMAMLTFNLMGLGLLFVLTAKLWGRGSAYFSLILAGFCPNFLGHMPLATSDFAGAWTLVLAVVCFARMLDKPACGSIALAGLTAGLAVITKQSGLVLGPVSLILLLWAASWKHFPKRLLASLAAALVCICVIWTAYGWRFAAANPEVGTIAHFQTDWKTIHEGGIVLRFVLGIAKDWHLLPEAFLFGLDFIFARSARGGFLNGIYSQDGYPLFYLWNFLYKTPLPALMLHIAGWGFVVRKILTRQERTKPEFRALLVLGGVYVLILLTTDLNIGYRHAFTVLYISCIFAATVFLNAMRSRIWVFAVVTAGALSLIPSAAVNADRYISYVNAIGGGEETGYLKLSDSSLDWGQDLPAVADYIKAARTIHPDTRFFLCTFGTGLPGPYGVPDTDFLPYWGFDGRKSYLPALSEGTYIISANALAMALNPWTQKHEIHYQKLKAASSGLYQKLDQAGTYRVEAANTLLADGEIATLDNYEFVRCRRLAYFLRSRKPDRILNGTMIVFELSEDELQQLDW